MNRIISLAVILIISITITSTAQEKVLKKVELTGVITDYDKKPIKGVRIFVDSLKTKAKTDKKGFYKILLSSENKLITAFSANHGLIDIEYTGQDKINFIFPKNNPILTKKQFIDLGYGASKDGNNPDYSSYSDIFQLLKSKFQNIVVSDGTVRIIGTGMSLSRGTYPPIFIVNGSQVTNISAISPSDIKYISVEKGNTSLYGSRGAGGVIKIKLK